MKSLELLAAILVTSCNRGTPERAVPSAAASTSPSGQASAMPAAEVLPPIKLRLMAGAQRSTPRKRAVTVVELGAEGLEPRLELGEVSAPYVCSLRTKSSTTATVTCTPDFRRVVAELEVERGGLRVALRNTKVPRVAVKHSASPQPLPTLWRPTEDDRPIELADSEVGVRQDDATCTRAERKVVSVWPESVNYYSGYPPAAQLLLVAPGVNPIKLIDQREPKIRWWKGCKSRTEGAEVRIECRKGETTHTVARIWPEPGAVAFESTIPTPGYGKLLMPCGEAVSVPEPGCFDCGNLYF